MILASQLPDSLSVDDILEMNLEDLKSIFTQNGIVIKGFTKSQLQSLLIKLNLTVGREDRDEVTSVRSQNSTHSNTPVESEAVALKRLEVELEMRRL